MKAVVVVPAYAGLFLGRPLWEVEGVAFPRSCGVSRCSLGLSLRLRVARCVDRPGQVHSPRPGLLRYPGLLTPAPHLLLCHTDAASSVLWAIPDRCPRPILLTPECRIRPRLVHCPWLLYAARGGVVLLAVCCGFRVPLRWRLLCWAFWRGVAGPAAGLVDTTAPACLTGLP